MEGVKCLWSHTHTRQKKGRGKKRNEEATKNEGYERCHEKDQWVTRKEGVMQLGVYSRGFTMDQIEDFCKHAKNRPLMGSVQTQWNPENEVPIPL